MFGAEGFSEFGFSEFVDTPLDSAAFEAFLKEPDAERVWLLELDVFSLAAVDGIAGTFSGEGFGEMGFSEGDSTVVGSVSTLRFSSHGYTSHSTDSPAQVWYDGRIQDGITVDRRINSSDGIGGLTEVFAEISLLNLDGDLDLLTANYSLNGRAARVLIGRPTDALSSFGQVFSGVVQTATIGDSVLFRLSDGMARLDVAINQTVYLGTGGNEGGADLTGKPKPKGWGKGFNVSPPLVDSGNLIYQYNDGASQDAPAAYDRQVALNKVVGAPAPGEYQVTASAGTFKLGGTPAGTVTCDEEGDNSGTGYVNTTADIIGRILRNQVGLTDSEIDPSTFGNLNVDAPAPVGIWAGTEMRTCRDVIGELLGNTAFGGFSRRNTFTVGLVNAPDGSYVETYGTTEIQDIKRVPLPSPLEPIAWRTTVGYQRNYTVQNDVAASVTAARRTFAAQDQRAAKHEDTTIKSRHLLATEFATNALYRDQADAQTEADRLFVLWGATQRKLLQVTMIGLNGMTRDIGQVIQLVYPRHGLTNGVAGVVLANQIKDFEVTLMVLV